MFCCRYCCFCPIAVIELKISTMCRSWFLTHVRKCLRVDHISLCSTTDSQWNNEVVFLIAIIISWSYYWHDTVISLFACLSNVHPCLWCCTLWLNQYQYVLQQKCLNKWIGRALLGTQFKTNFTPLHRLTCQNAHPKIYMSGSKPWSTCSYGCSRQWSVAIPLCVVHYAHMTNIQIMLFVYVFESFVNFALNKYQSPL